MEKFSDACLLRSNDKVSQSILVKNCYFSSKRLVISFSGTKQAVIYNPKDHTTLRKLCPVNLDVLCPNKGKF